MQESSFAGIRDQFFVWQCRIRQISMREQEGRPSAGMRPRVLARGGHELSPGMTVLIIPADPTESTDFFRFQVQKTNDPKEIYDKGLQYLQATHFSTANKFSDHLAAVFPAGSGVAGALLELEECLLEFSQFSQTYKLLCSVHVLKSEDAEFQAALWHNRIFNPHLSDDMTILSFAPDWSSAQSG